MPTQIANGKWISNLRLSDIQSPTEYDTEEEATVAGQVTAARIKEIATALGCKAANRAQIARRLTEMGVFVRPEMAQRSDMHDDGVCSMDDSRIMLGVTAVDECGISLTDDEVRALMLFA